MQARPREIRLVNAIIIHAGITTHPCSVIQPWIILRTGRVMESRERRIDRPAAVARILPGIVPVESSG